MSAASGGPLTWLKNMVATYKKTKETKKQAQQQAQQQALVEGIYRQRKIYDNIVKNG